MIFREMRASMAYKASIEDYFPSFNLSSNGPRGKNRLSEPLPRDLIPPRA